MDLSLQELLVDDVLGEPLPLSSQTSLPLSSLWCVMTPEPVLAKMAKG